MTDLQLAYETIMARRAAYRVLWSYYEGDPRIRYLTSELEGFFKKLDANFRENWAAVVVDAVWERVALRRFVVADDEPTTQILNDIWERSEMALDMHEAHLAALVCGEAYLIAWRESTDAPIEAYYNSPELCFVRYDPQHPRRKAWAAKMWDDETEGGKRYLTIYYPDRIEHYSSTGKAIDAHSYQSMRLSHPAALNPFGVVPVFHLRLSRTRHKTELDNVLGPQDSINKLISDMMTASDEAAFRQRWLVSNADITELENKAGEIWQLPPASTLTSEGTQVGEFSTSDLGQFLQAIEQRITSIGAITRTPKHYFFRQGGDPSGEALIAMEAPLVKKCERYIERFQVTAQRFAAWMLALDGKAIDPVLIQAIYDDPATVQPMTEAQIRQTNVATGIPLVTQLRDEGRDEAYIEQMQADKADESAAASRSLADALMRQQREFDSEQSDGA